MLFTKLEAIGYFLMEVRAKKQLKLANLSVKDIQSDHAQEHRGLPSEALSRPNT